MHKADYEAIARVLARYRGWQYSTTADSMAACISLDLAEVFAVNNPRFDKAIWFQFIQDHMHKDAGA